MRTLSGLLPLLAVAALVTSCSSSRTTTTAATAPAPTASTSAAPAPRFGPACPEKDPERLVCSFVVAVQNGDLARLTPPDRELALRVPPLPQREWRVGTCELVSDTTNECTIVFPADVAGTREEIFRFGAAPTNVTYEDGNVTTSNGEPIRWELTGFAGTGPFPPVG